MTEIGIKPGHQAKILRELKKSSDGGKNKDQLS